MKDSRRYRHHTQDQYNTYSPGQATMDCNPAKAHVDVLLWTYTWSAGKSTLNMEFVLYCACIWTFT